MSDKDNDGKTGGRGRAGPGGGMRGSVRQSFSHGRTKAVVVEMKRSKRIVAPGAAPATGGAAPASTAAPAGTTPAPAPQTGAKPAAVTLKPRPAEAPQAAPAAPAPRGDGAEAARPRPQQRPKMLNTLSEEEYARRLVALKQAKIDD